MTPDFLAQMADLTSHRIEGIAIMGNTPFSCPIITQVEGNLWQGGYLEDGTLPDEFGFVLSLYPWRRHRLGPTTVLREERLYDRGDVPDLALLEDLAAWVNEKRLLAPTLVHCQAGLNRSALVTGLALVRSGWTAEAAIGHMRARRSPAVLCNTAFERWLRTQ